METEGSLPQSHVPSTCPYPVQDSISPGPRLTVWLFRNVVTFLRWEVSTSPNPQAGVPPLVGCPVLLFQCIRSHPTYWRPFLHPQPEDTPCRGDRDPRITVFMYLTYRNLRSCGCFVLVLVMWYCVSYGKSECVFLIEFFTVVFTLIFRFTSV